MCVCVCVYLSRLLVITFVFGKITHRSGIFVLFSIFCAADFVVQNDPVMRIIAKHFLMSFESVTVTMNEEKLRGYPINKIKTKAH